MIDLHIHSTHSDGSDTPARLVELGRRVGLRAMALTDHDTMAGTEDFLVACRAHGMTGISGIEISVDVDGGPGSLHILGYGMAPHHPAIQKNLGWVLDGRAWRNERIVEKLNELGLELNLDEVRAYAGEDVVARPHIARALIGRGYVSTVAEAFDKCRQGASRVHRPLPPQPGRGHQHDPRDRRHRRHRASLHMGA